MTSDEIHTILTKLKYYHYKKYCYFVDFVDDNLFKIEPYFIDKLTHLFIEHGYSQEITKEIFPPKLTHLTFGNDYHFILQHDSLPNTLTYLKLNDIFNQEIEEDQLPKKLTYLQFGYYFNQIIKKNVLPINLHTLIFGTCFNTEIEINILPTNLHTLFFCNYYNKNIEANVLPKNLHYFKFFGNALSLPTSIIELSCDATSQMLNNLPEYLEVLNLDCVNNSDTFRIIDNFPSTLKIIKINKNGFRKYIKKIPFGCIIINICDNKVIE
jgi:hypothetical protein